MPSVIDRLQEPSLPPLLGVEPRVLLAFSTLGLFPAVAGAAARVLKLLQLRNWQFLQRLKLAEYVSFSKCYEWQFTQIEKCCYKGPW